MSGDSWYTQQYNALQNASDFQFQQENADWLASNRARSEQIRSEALQRMAAKESMNRAYYAEQSASNAQINEWNTSRNSQIRAGIEAKYATIDIPIGTDRVTATRLSTESGGAIARYSAPAQNTATGTQTASVMKSAQVIEAEFTRVASGSVIPASKQSPVIPNPVPLGLGRQIAGSVAGAVIGGVGTVAGSAIANTVGGGEGIGLGASLGGSIGGLVGSILGGTATGAATFGLGTFGGSLLGNAIGSTVGSFLGGLIDNAFGKKPVSSNLSISANTAPPSIAPFQGGQSLGVLYNHVVRYKIRGFSQIFSYASINQNASGEIHQDAGQLNGGISYVGTARNEGYTGIVVKNSAGVVVAHYASGCYPVSFQNSDPDPFETIFLSASFTRADGQPDTGGNLGQQSIGSTPYVPTFTPLPVTEQPKPSGGAIDVLEGDQQYIAGTGFRDRSKDPKLPVVTPSINPTNAPLGTSAAIAPSNRVNKPTATGANTGSNPSPAKNSISKPSFTARPYVSGVSDPSEAYDPRDINTGLTRSQQEKRYQDQLAAIQTAGQANSVAAANFDAQRINDQLKNLSNVPRQDLGGLSDREYQKQQYLKSIQGDKIKEDAFNKLQTPQPTPTPKNTNATGLNLPQPDLTTVVATLAAVKLGSDALVNASISNTAKIDQIASNTTPTAQQTNAKQGVCDAMQPSQCGYEGVKAATTDATNPIKDGVAANGGALASLLNLLTTVWEFLQNRLGKVLNILNNTVVDRTLAVMNLATGIHNAAMLTRDIGETLGSVVDNIISLTPLRFTNSEGSQVQFTDFIGSNFRALLVSVLGVENYTSLVLTWQKANTIYHAGMGVLNTTQSMLDPISSAVEYGMENVSKIGNSLKEDGVVSENSYPAMDETIRARRVNRFERLNDTLEGAENIASNLSSVTSSAVSVKEDYKQLREDAKDLKDKATAFNTADSEARAALKAELPTDITPITLAPAPAEDE